MKLTSHVLSVLNPPAYNPDLRSTEVHLGEGKLQDGSGCTLATIEPSQQRIDWPWNTQLSNSGLLTLMEHESNVWDAWSLAGEADAQSISQGEVVSFGKWIEKYPVAKVVCDRLRVDFNPAGKTMLEIGGSCKDGRYFLAGGAHSLHQIEVSRLSQRLGLERVKATTNETRGDFSDRVLFHNTPAEYLPFKDNVFDLVFARSTIHHCKRPAAIQEAFRVLKPGGAFMFFERYLGDCVYAMMQSYRRVRKVDRGSDDPLRYCELEAAGAMFKRATWEIINWQEPFDYFLLKLLRKKKTHRYVATPPVWANRIFGTEVVFLAVK